MINVPTKRLSAAELVQLLGKVARDQGWTLVKSTLAHDHVKQGRKLTIAVEQLNLEQGALALDEGDD